MWKFKKYCFWLLSYALLAFLGVLFLISFKSVSRTTILKEESDFAPQVIRIAVHDTGNPEVGRRDVILKTPLPFDYKEGSFAISIDDVYTLLEQYNGHRIKVIDKVHEAVARKDVVIESRGIMRRVTMINNTMPPVVVDSFNYINKPTNVCQKVKPKILAYVHTSPTNFENRKRLRDSWAANATLFPRELIQTIFVIGKTGGETEELRKNISQEAKTYGDLLYTNFTDSYVNLTYKAVVAMKYITTHCKQAKYIMKTDDDTVVNLPAVRTDIEKYDPKSLSVSCSIMRNMGPNRRFQGGCGKWYVDPKEYPVGKIDRYPPYCSGAGSAMTYAAFEKLYSRVPHEPWLWVDDVYFTGILGQHAPEIKLKNVKHGDGLRWNKRMKDGEDPKSFFYVSQAEPKQFRTIFDKIMS